jgi:ProP effector
MGNKNRRAAAHAAVTALVETFPDAFTRTDRKPLKLGVHDDLLARGIDPDVIQRGLGSYCQSTGYLNATKAGAARIDLDGNEVGAVTAEEAEHAAQKLAAAAERAKTVLANAAMEQARAAAAKAPGPASAKAERTTGSRAPVEKRTDPVTKRPPPVIVVRKSRRPGR